MNWPKQPIWWKKRGQWYCSITFTWQLPDVRQIILDNNIRPIVGGPAVYLLPNFLGDVADIQRDYPGVLQRANPLATRTTFGCPRACKFCGVRTIEGPYRELKDWPDLPVLVDSNFLASSWGHFNRVIDST